MKYFKYIGTVKISGLRKIELRQQAVPVALCYYYMRAPVFLASCDHRIHLVVRAISCY